MLSLTGKSANIINIEQIVEGVVKNVDSDFKGDEGLVAVFAGMGLLADVGSKKTRLTIETETGDIVVSVPGPVLVSDEIINQQIRHTRFTDGDVRAASKHRILVLSGLLEGKTYTYH